MIGEPAYWLLMLVLVVDLIIPMTSAEAAKEFNCNAWTLRSDLLDTRLQVMDIQMQTKALDDKRRFNSMKLTLEEEIQLKSQMTLDDGRTTVGQSTLFCSKYTRGLWKQNMEAFRQGPQWKTRLVPIGCWAFVVDMGFLSRHQKLRSKHSLMKIQQLPMCSKKGYVLLLLKLVVIAFSIWMRLHWRQLKTTKVFSVDWETRTVTTIAAICYWQIMCDCDCLCFSSWSQVAHYGRTEGKTRPWGLQTVVPWCPRTRECHRNNGRRPKLLVVSQGHQDGSDKIPFRDNAKCQLSHQPERSWVDHDVLIRWFDEKFKPWIGDAAAYLVLDNAGCHTKGNDKNRDYLLSTIPGEDAGEFETHAFVHNVKVIWLPPNMTHDLQPLDVGVFGPLKKTMKAAYTQQQQRRDREADLAHDKDRTTQDNWFITFSCTWLWWCICTHKDDDSDKRMGQSIAINLSLQ